MQHFASRKTMTWKRMTVANRRNCKGRELMEINTIFAPAGCMQWLSGSFQTARALMMSMLISLGSVACSSNWMPSSSLLNLSLELAYSILLLTLDVSGDLQGVSCTNTLFRPPLECKNFTEIKQKFHRNQLNFIGKIVENSKNSCSPKEALVFSELTGRAHFHFIDLRIMQGFHMYQFNFTRKRNMIWEISQAGPKLFCSKWKMVNSMMQQKFYLLYFVGMFKPKPMIRSVLTLGRQMWFILSYQTLINWNRWRWNRTYFLKQNWN